MNSLGTEDALVESSVLYMYMDIWNSFSVIHLYETCQAKSIKVWYSNTFPLLQQMTLKMSSQRSDVETSDDFKNVCCKCVKLCLHMGKR